MATTQVSGTSPHTLGVPGYYTLGDLARFTGEPLVRVQHLARHHKFPVTKLAQYRLVKAADIPLVLESLQLLKRRPARPTCPT
jgi:hypothetical protein